MRNLDHDYVDEIVSRLRSLDPETRPKWGRMSAREMVGHLAEAVRYSMGRGPELRDCSTWFTRTVLRRLLFWGVVRIPRNVTLPRPEAPRPALRARADLETLHALMEEYLAVVQAGELSTPHHPILGNIGVDGWARMHMLHFEHHLRQFGV